MCDTAPLSLRRWQPPEWASLAVQIYSARNATPVNGVAISPAIEAATKRAGEDNDCSSQSCEKPRPPSRFAWSAVLNKT